MDEEKPTLEYGKEERLVFGQAAAAEWKGLVTSD
jgi:hypothetical protein